MSALTLADGTTYAARKLADDFWQVTRNYVTVVVHISYDYEPMRFTVEDDDRTYSTQMDALYRVAEIDGEASR